MKSGDWAWAMAGAPHGPITNLGTGNLTVYAIGAAELHPQLLSGGGGAPSFSNPTVQKWVNRTRSCLYASSEMGGARAGRKRRPRDHGAGGPARLCELHLGPHGETAERLLRRQARRRATTRARTQPTWWRGRTTAPTATRAATPRASPSRATPPPRASSPTTIRTARSTSASPAAHSTAPTTRASTRGSMAATSAGSAPAAGTGRSTVRRARLPPRRSACDG